MKTAVFVGVGLPLEIQDRPMPVPGKQQAVIRVARCGICATDFRMTSGSGFDLPHGTPLGHEYAGEVVEVGSGSELRVGDRVTSLPLSSCCECVACRSDAPLHCPEMQMMQGGYGQFTLIDERWAVRLPTSVSLADAALTEPLACGARAMRKVPELHSARVAVLGTGAMGVAAIYWARRLGAGRIAAIARSRRGEAVALSMGADRLLTADESLQEQLTAVLGGPADVVVEAAGSSGLLQQAMDLVRPRGTVISLGGCGAPDPIVPFIGMMKELDIRFSVAYGRADFIAAVEALDSGTVPIQAMVAQTIALRDLPVEFEALRHDRRAAKVMVDPWSDHTRV